MNKTAVDFPLENLCFNRQKTVTQLAAATSGGTLCAIFERQKTKRKMKNIFTLIASSMTLFNVHCQTIKDTIFNEVYIIKTENIIKNDNALFIDITIEPQKAPVVLTSSNRNVSAKLFCDRRIFLPEQNKFILITPDWEFIKEIREIEKREGIHIKAEKHKFYYIERNITDCKIDSLSRSIHDVRNPITLNYKEVKNVISKKNTKKIRGFILDNAEYTKTKVPIVEALIEVKATERKTSPQANRSEGGRVEDW